jgi:hypothetical protein
MCESSIIYKFFNFQLAKDFIAASSVKSYNSAAAEPFLNGSSTAYVEEMYNAWLRDPASVHAVRNNSSGIDFNFSIIDFLLFLVVGRLFPQQFILCAALPRPLAEKSRLGFAIYWWISLVRRWSWTSSHRQPRR